jgi:hypothetical protein
MNRSAQIHALLASLLPFTVVGAFSPMICHCQEVPGGLKFEIASVKPAEFPSAAYAAGAAAGAPVAPLLRAKLRFPEPS